MEHTKQKMAQARQQRMERKIKEAKQRQNTSKKNPQVDRKPSSALTKFIPYLTISHNTSLVLGGAAAGIAITAIVWWAKSVGMSDDSSMISLKSDEAIQTSDIKKSSNNIDRLNKRVELLTGNISNLEAKLTRVMVLTDSINGVANKHVAAAQQRISEFADTKSTFDTMEPPAAGVASTAPKMEDVFTPTHTVKAKLNLRPSTSLNSIPITVLKVGTEIEYINEADGWYYVNTQSHGKGWCSSDYLSPLL